MNTIAKLVKYELRKWSMGHDSGRKMQDFYHGFTPAMELPIFSEKSKNIKIYLVEFCSYENFPTFKSWQRRKKNPAPKPNPLNQNWKFCRCSGNMAPRQYDL